MKLITIIIFGVLALGMSVMYTIFHKENGYKALLIRGASVLSCFALALVAANLNSLSTALPLLIFFGLMFMLLSEAMVVCPIENEKPKMIVFGFLKGLTFACFGLSALSLSYFNIFAVAAGILFGAGIGCVICAIKKYKKGHQVFSTLMIWVAIGFLLVQAVYACLNSTHMICSIMMAGAAAMMMISQFIRSFTKEGHKLQYVMSLLYILGTAVMAASIYFY